MITEQLIQETAGSTAYFQVQSTDKSIDIATGIGVALLCSHLPFIVSFSLARTVGLTAANYSSIEPTAAAAGLAICLLAMPIAFEMKDRSLQAIAVASTVIFWLLGLLASFTV